MHDGEDSGFSEILAFDFFVVWEQTRDPFVTVGDGVRYIRIDHRRNLTLCQHRVHLAGWNHLDLQSRRRCEWDILATLEDPSNFFVRHAVMFFQDTAQPDVARRLKVSAGDSLADKIPGRLDARIHIDESKAVTESAVQKNGNRRNRVVPVTRHKIGTDVEFAYVELLVARHAPVSLSRPVAGQHHKFNPVRL